LTSWLDGINMHWMRTTIALDDDLARKLQELAHKQHVSFRKIVNDVLRRGLSAQEPRRTRKEPFRAETFDSPFRTGVDPLRLNQLVDELEVQRRLT
jgi:hypothetical protein